MPGCKSEFEIVPDIEMKNRPEEMWERERGLMTASGE